MQRLIIVRGNSASGKTTVAKKLREKLGYKTMLLSQDVIRREILRVRDTAGNPSIQLIYDTAMYGKNIGYDVIVEGILYTEKCGDMLHKLIDDFGGEHYVYYFDIPFDETLRRHTTKPSASEEYGEAEMRSWWREKDYLNIPNEKIITENLTQDQIIEMIYSDIK